MKILALLILLPISVYARDNRRNFSVAVQNLTIPTSGVGQSVLTLFNPSTSTHRVLIDKLYIHHETGSDSDPIRWSLRRGAVLTSSGTLQNVKKLNIGQGGATSIEAGLNPTSSDNGSTLFYATSYRDSPLSIDFDEKIRVRPGKNIYLRGRALQSALEVNLTVIWHEDGK